MRYVTRILVVLTTGFFLGSAGSASAAALITIDQIGLNVVATGTGSLDLAGLTFEGNLPTDPRVNPSIGSVIEGPAHVLSFSDFYQINNPMGPGSFGLGALTFASSGSGSSFGLQDVSDLIVPGGYVSGASLSATDTYSNQTLASLGLTPGTYVYTLPADTLKVQIGTATATPEPSSVILIGTALTGLGVARWRKRKQAA